MSQTTKKMADLPDKNFRVLVVEDLELYAQAIGRELKRRHIDCTLAHTASDALELSQAGEFQAILLDHKLPDDDGIRIIPILLGRQPKCSLIVMTAYETIPNAIQAIRQGADDYVVKETSIQPIVDRVCELQRKHAVYQSAQGWDEHRKDGLLGNSPGMVRVREQIEKVAARPNTPVLLTGETGVGKEVAARYLHSLSAPARSPFISVDCVALPANLVESLLFGHEKGAFTGAHCTRNGVFQEAGQGTILLDEIGDMDLALQGKLLRVLETRKFQRVGSVREYDVGARVVAATNCDLLELVGQGSFRLDLFQRLSVFPIHIPPLRDRGDDILLMARHFIEFFARKMELDLAPLNNEVQNRLACYDYPGNVREMKNIIERALIMTDSNSIELKHLPERLLGSRIALGGQTTGSSAAIDFIPGVDTMETLEEKLVRHALKQTGGVKGEAAKLLGISRFQLLRRMQKYQMQTKGQDGN